MKNAKFFKSFSSIVAVVCFSVSSSGHSLYGTPPTATPDELSDVVQAAKAGISTLNDFATANQDQIKLTNTQLRVQTTAIQSALAETRTILEALRSLNGIIADGKESRDATSKSTLARIESAVVALKRIEATDYKLTSADANTVQTSLDATSTVISDVSRMYSQLQESAAIAFEKLKADARSDIENLEAKIKELSEHARKLEAMFGKMNEVEAKMESLMPTLLAMIGNDEAAQKTKACLSHITQDPIFAANLLAAARAHLNDPAALSQVLKNEAPRSIIDVREVKETTGLIVVFRTGGLTHCLSTKQQCGGKAYSLGR